MVYTVVLTASARKEIRALSREMQESVRGVILSLATDPRPFGYIKLHGREGYRIRVGDYRVLYTIDDDGRIVIVGHVGHRRDIYR